MVIEASKTWSGGDMSENGAEAIRQLMTEELATLFPRPSFQRGHGEDFVLRAFLRYDSVFLGASTIDVTVDLLDGQTGAKFRSYTRRAQDATFDGLARHRRVIAQMIRNLVEVKEALITAFDDPVIAAKLRSKGQTASNGPQALAKVREEAERRARAEAEQLAKARTEAERAAHERAAEAAQARAQAQREAQARAEREAKEAASGLAGTDWGRRRPLAEAAVGVAAQAEARGDAAGALRAYHRAWLLVYRDEDEALRGRVEEALVRLAARLAEKPPVDEAARRHAVQGDAYFDARRFDEAAAAYTRLLAVAPWHAVGRYNLALALAAQERYAEAIAEMRRFLQLVPDGPTARTAQDTIYKWETQLR